MTESSSVADPTANPTTEARVSVLNVSEVGVSDVTQSEIILNALPLGILLADRRGKVIHANAAALKLLGAANIEGLLRTLHGFELRDPDGKRVPHANGPLQLAVKGQTVRDRPYEVHGFGMPVWVAAFTTELVRNDGGDIEHIVVTIRDVTEEAKSRRALHESDDQFRLAVEAAELGTWFSGPGEGEVTWSERCKAIFGLKPDARITRSEFVSRIHPDDRDAVEAAIRDTLETGHPYNAEFRVVWPDGSVHWVQSWGRRTTYPDGPRPFMQGVVVSIDDRKAVEHRKQDVASTLRAIIDSSPMAIVTTDHAGRVVIWNPSAERMLGFAAADVVGKPTPFTFDQETGAATLDCALPRADGQLVEVLCSFAPMRSDEGALTGHLLMFSDITERKRVQTQLEHVQRLESLGVLAGGVAHDFNNLLTGIIGNASLATYTLEPEHAAQPMLKDVLRAGERAAALTKQLLAYAGKGRFLATLIDLNGIARDAVAAARTSIENPRVTLTLDLAPDLPKVEADPGQMHQVLLSLVSNGIEAIVPEDSGTVEVRTRVERLTQSGSRGWEAGAFLESGHYVVVDVIDTGIGIDADTRTRIFEPFFSTKFTGRGLGLSAVLGIVRQHNGAIALNSSPGSGTRFSVYLPVASGQLGEEPPIGDAEKALDAGLILVVDDEQTVRETLRRALEHWNYSAILAEHGQIALEVFPAIAAQVHAVILDLTMPVMGGEETLRHLRKIRPDVPVILTSGYSQAEAMRRMEGKGVSAFLQKPFTVDQVVGKLRNLLGVKKF